MVLHQPKTEFDGVFAYFHDSKCRYIFPTNFVILITEVVKGKFKWYKAQSDYFSKMISPCNDIYIYNIFLSLSSYMKFLKNLANECHQYPYHMNKSIFLFQYFCSKWK